VITFRAHRVVENWILDDPDRLDVAHVRPVHDGLTIDFRQFLWSVSRAGKAGVGRPGVPGRPRSGQIPIDRSGGRAADALATATRVLESGDVWAFTPRAPAPVTGACAGIMRVALTTGAPVVTLVAHGTYTINPIDPHRWHCGRIHLAICPPLDLTQYQRGRSTSEPAEPAPTT
jgi:hypothetical protein